MKTHSDPVPRIRWLRAAAALVLGVVLAFDASAAQQADLLVSEDFETGLERWALVSPDHITIRTEPEETNHVLELTPKREDFVHAILNESRQWRNVRLEGRFQFPTEGDGYLGFLYNYQEKPGRVDSGCLYVKSNGSYVRISPHHDGNPSWRLYEELKLDLEGERRIEPRRWYRFRLDVRGAEASLFLDDLETPVVRFDLFPHQWGALGLEARPGGGEPVWVDDLRVSRLSGAERTDSPEPSPRPAEEWEILGPFVLDEGAGLEPPELPSEGWRPVEPDPRGAIITGRTTQYLSGEADVVYLRTRFDVAEGAAKVPTWLAASSANRLDVWFNGYYRGTVAPERFIWSDYLTSRRDPGARLPLSPSSGSNELILRVHGRRFAGGGMFLALTGPGQGQ